MTTDEMAREIVSINDQISALRERKQDIEQHLAAEMTGPRLEIPGVGVFERHRQTARKAWRHDELQATLIRKLRAGEIPKRVDTETGEVIDEDDIERTARVFTETANPSWRVTALKAYDIDASEYNETVYSGGWAIQVTRTGVA